MAKSARTVTVKVGFEVLEDVRELVSILRELKAAGVADADLPDAAVGVQSMTRPSTLVQNIHPASGLTESEVARLAGSESNWQSRGAL